ncbi:MAG: hypothetical protein HeimC2_20490 [Candidatus Heimdallarchaeota archaeon LC_2]|nr:MAG: hypothetical protein HeimC2_20490 [Candidatus Heimdallarchaeota archaeon LC_2]
MSLEHNKTIARQFLTELFSKWDFSLIEKIIHNDYSVSKNSVSLIDFKDSLYEKPGKGNFRERLHYIRTGMPDLEFQVTKMVAEGNEVIVWYTWSGTQKGELFGFPPKNRKVKIFATNYFTIQAKKIVGTRITLDSFSFLYQLGHVDFINDESLVLRYLSDIERISSEFSGSIPSKSDPLID